MKNYDHIPQTVETFTESAFHWAQFIRVPEGWDYLRNYASDYETAESEVIVTLDTEGDWLEIVSEAERQRILYMIV